MKWTMTRAERRQEKRLNRQFKRKYSTKSKKNHKALPPNISSFGNDKWRRAILKHDDYTCQHCGLTDDLHAHHIKSKSEFPYLRYELKNGITLCEHCHNKIHDGLLDYYKQRAFLRQIVQQRNSV